MQFKTNSLAGSFEHVLRDDPAFDQKAEGFDKAFERAVETGDFSAVPRTPGGPEPAVWTLRHLTERQWRFCLDLIERFGSSSALYDMVALGLESVKGAGIAIERDFDVRRRGWEVVKEEQLDEIERRFRGAINELANRIGAVRRPRNG